MSNCLIRTLMSGAALVSWTSVALAQTSPSAAPVSEQVPETLTPATGLSEIVVTARRRAERLQSVPISASAFDANSLTQRNISNTQDLLGQVPSLVVGGSGQQRSTENITSRGQGATFNAAPGGVL